MRSTSEWSWSPNDTEKPDHRLDFTRASQKHKNTKKKRRQNRGTHNTPNELFFVLVVRASRSHRI